MPVLLGKGQLPSQFRVTELRPLDGQHIRICGTNLKPFISQGIVTQLLLLKERIESDTLFQDRKKILEKNGATCVGLLHDPQSNPWLRGAFELPTPHADTLPATAGKSVRMVALKPSGIVKSRRWPRSGTPAKLR
jgi:hypothetical protein